VPFRPVWNGTEAVPYRTAPPKRYPALNHAETLRVNAPEDSDFFGKLPCRTQETPITMGGFVQSERKYRECPCLTPFLGLNSI
jgi:hypothetical protein